MLVLSEIKIQSVNNRGSQLIYVMKSMQLMIEIMISCYHATDTMWILDKGNEMKPLGLVPSKANYVLRMSLFYEQ